MRRILRVGGVTASLGLVTLGVLAASPATAATARAERVLVVSYPRVTWDLVAEVEPPALLTLLGRGAVASMSVQTAADVTTIEDGYLTLGAGNRAMVRTGPGAGPDISSEADGVLVEPVPTEHGWATYGATSGALGQALVGAGKSSAVVANADVSDPIEEQRSAALAAIDTGGRAGGTVSPTLARPDSAAPGGRAQDDAAVLAAFDAAWGSPGAVIVEMSDLERAAARGTRADLAAALQRADDLLVELVRRTDPARDAVVVVAPVAPGDRAELTVFGLAAPGIEAGSARSATTRRAGYVTLPDVAPTVLDLLGVAVPAEMTGTPITSGGGRVLDAARAVSLAERDRYSVFREQIAVPVAVGFLLLQLVVYAGVALGFRHERVRLVLRVGLLAVLAFPGLTFVSGVVDAPSLGRAGFVALLVGASLAVGLVVALCTWRRLLAGPLALAAATWLLLVVDALRAGRWQLDTPFGYSPITAARFSGMGNLGLALLMVTSIVVATGAWPLWPGVGLTPDPLPLRAPRLLLGLAAAGFATAVVADGWPGFGADVGGVLALLPALSICWLVLAGRQVSWRRLALVLVVAVAAVAAFAAVDLLRPRDDRTHLGRFAQRVLDGDAFPTLTRKVLTNAHVLLHPGVLLATAVAAVAAVAAYRSPRAAELRQRVPGVVAALCGAAVGAVLGFGVNDSGIVVPGMMLAVLVPWFVHVAFAVDDEVVERAVAE